MEIAPLFETMCKVNRAQSVFNCNAPNRGSMEMLAKAGPDEVQVSQLGKMTARELNAR